MLSSKFIGVIPAAGLGSRLAPFAYPKELLPIIYTKEESGCGVALQPVMQFSLDLLRTAGVTHCYVIISSWKFEIARIFEDGANAGISLSYIIRNSPHGLADAVNCVSTWATDHCVCLVLPDVIIQPQDALHQVCIEQLSTGADVVLGVFPSSTPEQFGPVSFSLDGNVHAVFDKPKHTKLRNTWGIAVWSPVFTQYLNVLSSGRILRISLGDAFQHAIEKGLKIRAVYFDNGTFIDLGTPEAIEALIEKRLILSL